MRYELPDGRVLLDDVSFRVGEGAKVALVGANGAGKTTLLRLITGDLEPHGGAVTRSGGLGVMRQFVGTGATARRADRRRPAAHVAPPRVAGRRLRGRRWELALMEHDDEKTQLGYAAGALRLRRRRWLRPRGHLGRLHDRRAGGALRPGQVPHPGHPVGGRAEAAGPGVPAPRARRGAAARRAGQLPRRPRQDLAGGADPRVGEDHLVHQPRPRAARQHRHPRRHRGARRERQHGVDPPRRLRLLPRGPPRPLRALRGAAPTLGRGARQAQGAGAALQDQGRVQRRSGQPATAPPRPGCASSRRPVRRPSSPREQQVTMRLQGGRTGKRAVVCEPWS